MIAKKNENIITIEFEEHRHIVAPALFQHNTGQVIKFNDVPDGAEVQFSNENSEKTTNKIVKDSQVEIPDFLVAEGLEITAYIQYVSETSETTVKIISIPVEARVKQGEVVAPEDEQTFREEIEGILNETKDAAKEAADKVEVNRKYLDEMEKKSTDTIENITTVGEAQINAINEVAKGKLFDINGTATSQIDALNRTAQAQIESINNVAKQNIETGTNSIVREAQNQIGNINNVASSRIEGINQVARSQIYAINQTALSQITAINQTGQAQSKAIELQASKVYNNLGIWIGTATLKTMGPNDYAYNPYIIPRTGKYIRLDSMIINGSEVEFNETNYLEVRLSSNSDGTGNISGIFKIKETGKNYSLERYDSIYKYILLVPYYSSAGLDCTIKYTLIEYDVKAEILALQQALIGVDELIGGDDNE